MTACDNRILAGVGVFYFFLIILTLVIDDFYLIRGIAFNNNSQKRSCLVTSQEIVNSTCTSAYINLSHGNYTKKFEIYSDEKCTLEDSYNKAIAILDNYPIGFNVTCYIHNDPMKMSMYNLRPHIAIICVLTFFMLAHLAFAFITVKYKC